MKSAVERLVAYIRTRRAELGISQNELARLSGLNPGTLANIMVGRVTKSPSLDTLQKLAVGLQVEADLLFRIARGDAPGGGSGAHRGQVGLPRPKEGRFPLQDEEWEVLESSHRAGIYVDLDRHKSLLDVSPADRKWLFHNLASLASSIEVHDQRLSKSS